MAEITISGYTVLVDDADVEKILKHRWHIHKSKRHLDLGIYYFISNASKKQNTPALRLHRYILDYYGDLSVDHINMNTLDCRKENLRIVPQITNIYNRRIQSNCTSGNRGIYYTNNKWFVAYTINDKRTAYSFPTQESAQCVAKYLIENRLADRGIFNSTDTYGVMPATFSEESTQILQRFINRTLKGLRCDRDNAYRGVHYTKSIGKWQSQLQVNGKTHYCGTFITELEAALAYDRKAYFLLGDKAKLNFPERVEEYKEAVNG